MQNIDRIITPIFLLAAVLGLVFFNLFYLPGLVPDQYQTRAVLFSMGGMLVVAYLLHKWMAAFDQFVATTLVLMMVVPYFEMYLQPVVGPNNRVLIQVALLLLTMLGLMRVPTAHRNTWVNKLNVAWLFFQTLSLIATQDFSLSWASYLTSVVGPSLFLYIIHNRILLLPDGIRRTVRLLLAMTALYAVTSVVLVMIGLGSFSVLNLFINRYGYKLPLGLYSAASFSAVTIFIVPLLFWLLINKKYNIGVRRSLLAALLIAITFIDLATLSRGVFLTLGLAVAYMWLYIWRLRGRQIIWWSLLMAFAMAAAALLLVHLVQFEAFADFLSQRLFGATGAGGFDDMMAHTRDDPRTVLFGGAMQLLAEHWPLGVGAGNTPSQMEMAIGLNFDCHNLAMDMLVGQGVFTFLIFLGFLGAMVSWFRRPAAACLDKTHWELGHALFAGVALYLVLSNITGGSFISNTEIISGVINYLFFISLALQYEVTHTRPRGRKGSAPEVQTTHAPILPDCR